MTAPEPAVPPAASCAREARGVGDGGAGSVWRLVARTLTASPLALVGVLLIVSVALFCFVGPLIYHTDQVHTNLTAVNEAPSSSHPLGTDESGFDILGRLMVGGQSSLEIGLAVAVIATSLGVLWGATSGFLGGVVDAIMMRIVDTVLAVPSIFLFVYLATVFRPSVALLILALSLLSWLGPARLVRGETLGLRTREYVLSARAAGGRSGRIVLRHIVPNAMGTIVVNAAFQVADAILALATLSFLGFGLPPPAATWGGMLSQGTNYLLDGYWWEAYPAGVLIVVIVVALNLVGDALRDSFDVRLRRG